MIPAAKTLVLVKSTKRELSPIGVSGVYEKQNSNKYIMSREYNSSATVSALLARRSASKALHYQLSFALPTITTHIYCFINLLA